MTTARILKVALGGVALVASLAMAGCVVRPYRAYGTVVYSAPPPPRVTMQPPAPGPGYAWVNGYWHWNGGQWVWMDGNWVAQRAGYVYIGPSWQQQGGGYVYVQGGWRAQQGGVYVNQNQGYVNQPQGGVYVNQNQGYVQPRGAVVVNAAPAVQAHARRRNRRRR